MGGCGYDCVGVEGSVWMCVVLIAAVKYVCVLGGGGEGGGGREGSVCGCDCVGVGVIVWVGVGVIAWVWKGVCGWYSLNCCCKVCVLGGGGSVWV